MFRGALHGLPMGDSGGGANCDELQLALALSLSEGPVGGTDQLGHPQQDPNLVALFLDFTGTDDTTAAATALQQAGGDIQLATELFFASAPQPAPKPGVETEPQPEPQPDAEPEPELQPTPEPERESSVDRMQLHSVVVRSGGRSPAAEPISAASTWYKFCLGELSFYTNQAPGVGATRERSLDMPAEGVQKVQRAGDGQQGSPTAEQFMQVYTALEMTRQVGACALVLDAKELHLSPLTVEHVISAMAATPALEGVILAASTIGCPQKVSAKRGKSKKPRKVGAGAFIQVNGQWGEVIAVNVANTLCWLQWLRDGRRDKLVPSAGTDISSVTRKVLSRTDLSEDYAHLEMLSKAINNSDNLVRLDVAHSNFNERSLSLLVSNVEWTLSKLSWVSLCGNPVGPGASVAVLAFEQNPQLGTMMGISPGQLKLDLRNKQVESGQTMILAAEMRLRRNASALESIDLSSNKIGDEAMVVLLDALRDFPLIALNIADCSLKLKSVDKLAQILSGGLSFARSIAELSLRQNTLTGDLVSVADGAAPTDRLEQGTAVFLEGEYYEVINDPKAAVLLRELATGKEIDSEIPIEAMQSDHFVFFENDAILTQDVFATLCKSLQHTSITELDMSDCHLMPKNCKDLSDYLRTVVGPLRLAIADCALAGATEGAYDFDTRGHKWENIDRNLTDFAGLCEAMVTTSHLDISNCHLGPGSAMHLASLSAGPSTCIVDLNLSGNPIADEAMIIMLQKLQQSAMVSLDISFCEVGVPTATKLGEMLSGQSPFSSAVRRISILGCVVGDAAGILIDAFVNNANLETLLGIETGVAILDLSNKQIESGQAKILAAEMHSRRCTKATTSISLLNNSLGDGGDDISKAFIDRDDIRTLCGLDDGIDVIDWGSRIFLRKVDDTSNVALLAADLSARRSTACLHELNLSRRHLAGATFGKHGLQTIDSEIYGFAALCTAARTIARLNLSDCMLGPASARCLAKLFTNGCLVEANLSGCPLTGSQQTNRGSTAKGRCQDEWKEVDSDVDGFADLCEAVSSSACTYLDMSDCHLGAVSAEYVARMLVASQLTTVSLLYNNFGNDGTSKVAHAFALTDRLRTVCGFPEGIKSVDWTYEHTPEYRDKSAADIVLLAADMRAQRSTSELSKVALDDNTITGSKLDYFGEKLEVVDSDMSGFQALCESRAPITILSFKDCSLGPEAIALLAQSIHQFPSVEHLVVSGNQIGSNGSRALTDGVRASVTLKTIVHDGTDPELDTQDAEFVANWTHVNRDGRNCLLGDSKNLPTEIAFFAAENAHPMLELLLEEMDESVVAPYAVVTTREGQLQSIATLLAAAGSIRGLIAIGNRSGVDLARHRVGGSSSVPTVVETAMVSSSDLCRTWASSYGSYLGRYRIDAGPPVHVSQSALVHFGTDVTTGGLITLKRMHRDEFESELALRCVDGQELPADIVIRATGWHAPIDEGTLAACTTLRQEPERTKNTDTFQYVLVMNRGERSLHDVCAKERIAGYRSEEIISIMRSVLYCMQGLHSCGVVHGDFKQRNILRAVGAGTESAQWVLCDMDAAGKFGSQIGNKTSTGYAPPELATKRFSNRGDTVLASESFDIWGFGVVLFEMCAGRTLFAQDTSNDELVESADRTRLCTWLCISDSELLPVFQNADTSLATVAAAKDLIRWCLACEPDDRPTVDQILAHQFFNEDPVPWVQRPMRYHAFISHAQADASGTASTLLFAYKQLGLHNWLDMRQEQLTLEGMRQGVRDSSIFLLILTEHVLTSWFCQQEMLTAILEGKPIQLVVELEPRFNPFPKAEWQRHSAHTAIQEMKNQAGNVVTVPSEIVEMINQHLPNAITYRRRDFEQDAMMQELCERNGIVLPCTGKPAALTVVERHPLAKVFVICADTPEAGAILSELRSVASGVELVQDDLKSASRVLLLLTAGVLRGSALQHLLATIAEDNLSGKDRITAIFSEEAGWTFGCSEQTTAPELVQNCLNEHEAIAWRANDPTGPNRHEFSAMVSHVLKKLGALENQATYTTTPTAVSPIAGVRDRLSLAERVISEHEVVIAAQAAELISLREQMLSREGVNESVPPKPEKK